MFGNLRRLERGRVAPIRHRQVAGRPHELRATHRDVPPAREWQYPKMDGRPSPPFPSSSPPPSSEVTPRDPPPHSAPPTPRATSDGPARRAASSHASETRRRGEARGPDEWSRVACRTRGRRLAEPRAVGALPGVTDYGDLRRRARGSRYPTSDCSQEKRRKSGKSRRCRPISALLNENRLHHGRGRARASHPSARFWAVPVGAGCPLAHPLAPSVSHGRPSIEERVRLEFRSLPHRRRTTGRALASRQRVDKAGTLPVKARWWPSR